MKPSVGLRIPQWAAGWAFNLGLLLVVLTLPALCDDSSSSELHSIGTDASGGKASLRSSVKFYEWNPSTEDMIKRHRIKTLMLLFADKGQASHWEGCYQALQHAANIHKKRDILHVAVPVEFIQPFQFFLGDDPENDAPFAVIVEVNNGFKKYRLTADSAKGGSIISGGGGNPVCSNKALERYEKSYFDGKLTPWLRSEEPYEDEGGGALKPLVGAHFEQKVIKAKKDVAVFFYAPWCGHCKRFEPRFSELADKHRNVESLIFYKIDITKNDVVHKGVKVDRVPYVRLFPANDKDTPRVFEHSRPDVVGYGSDFLSKNADIKFDLAKANEAAAAKHNGSELLIEL
ncbi:unnamed protein product [Vitrella brassicaformis CCMP3155]|uniref:protein disulfide-isomerase n=2 Tax=Vitrella brassicaformis TaxID=1169539 RepID=A0A0G4G3Y9_VITBC|nr:unnamed protein product [Vitrella brassicaformis CCMP3155]|mmetsp:Transcript_20231/g.49133  ORF Transcript_20231/g.49133 Transcript_20231/m.49133 type:complete len:345 (+) Transcript_20231:76-1110(+)|eukprot:CEM23147.1 unnamed protein product [Vitrella brassicaformis CCMP3155]